MCFTLEKNWQHSYKGWLHDHSSCTQSLAAVYASLIYLCHLFGSSGCKVKVAPSLTLPPCLFVILSANCDWNQYLSSFMTRNIVTLLPVTAFVCLLFFSQVRSNSNNRNIYRFLMIILAKRAMVHYFKFKRFHKLHGSKFSCALFLMGFSRGQIVFN